MHAFLPPHAPAFPRCSPHTRRHVTTCTLAPPPATYDSLHKQATTSALLALRAKNVPLIEIQFPPVANMATAALNELLDANRAYVRELMDALTNEFPARNCILLFPDRKEANLARKVYGEVKFTISSIPKKAPTYMADTEMKENGVIVIVQPGFNVEEYMCMPNVMGCAPVVCVNGDLDRVRGAYYPRLFYPGLYKVKEKFLSMFEEVFYVKAFSNGGSLMRRFPEKWRLFYKGTGDMREVWTGDDRPDFKDVERILRDCRTADLRAR